MAKMVKKQTQRYYIYINIWKKKKKRLFFFIISYVKSTGEQISSPIINLVDTVQSLSTL